MFAFRFLMHRRSPDFFSLIGSLFVVSSLLCSGLSTASPKASVVDIVQQEGAYTLRVNGELFDVRGVGLDYTSDTQLRALKDAGGNSFRTWSTHKLDRELKLASELGLMIAVGIDTGKELQGFDYNNKRAVAAQFKRVKKLIRKYKNHPNILAWVIANEPNLLFNEQGGLKDVNPKVYKALGDIVDYIHKVDPNHPVTFTFAGASEAHIRTALSFAPNVDFISVQVYGGLGGLGEAIQTMNVEKPFMVTEFGPVGHWETPSTAWGREIEEPSAIKAAGMAERMERTILNDTTGKIIGSYAFLWGQKQERTPTWYGMFNASGDATARVDELTRMWTGEYPVNRAPLSYAIMINDKTPQENVSLLPGETATADLQVSDPDGDDLNTTWYFMGEVDVRSQGGHHEEKPKEFSAEILSSIKKDDRLQVTFRAPVKPGEYRLFAYSYDGQGHVANANIPFLVTE